MMKNIGLIIELDHGKIKKTNLGMITLARAKGAQLFAFIFDSDANAFKGDLESFGITKIIEISLSKDQANNPVVRADAIIEAVKAYHISIVVGLSTAMGKDLLPRIAALLEAPLVMDCFYVDFEKNLVKTSRYSGKTIAMLRMTGPVRILGVRPNAVEAVPEKVSAQILKFDGSHLISRDLKVMNTGDTGRDTPVSLPEADIIIAGGRGMKNGENFVLLSRCAEKLNAAVGASRVAVDSGWVPYSMQVGQTGEKVSPRVYIACGISGSIQHFAGMKTSGLIIAINKDETAAIMSNCDYYVTADALEVIPELIKYLEDD